MDNLFQLHSKGSKEFQEIFNKIRDIALAEIKVLTNLHEEHSLEFYKLPVELPDGEDEYDSLAKSCYYLKRKFGIQDEIHKIAMAVPTVMFGVAQCMEDAEAMKSMQKLIGRCDKTRREEEEKRGK